MAKLVSYFGLSDRTQFNGEILPGTRLQLALVNHSVCVDCVQLFVQRANVLRLRRLSGEDVEHVSVLGHIAQNVSVKSCHRRSTFRNGTR